MLRNSEISKERAGEDRVSRLWDKPAIQQTPLGCPSCPEYGVCGGLRTERKLFDCTALCCGTPNSCGKVCRLNRDFVARVREVRGFHLHCPSSTAGLTSPELPHAIPFVYHVARLDRLISAPFIGIPLYRMCGRDGVPRFSSREGLRAAFKLESSTEVVLSGTAQDAPLERWWGLETSGRIAVIRSLKRAGVSLVTTPNFSLAASVPRWNDLHAMKRIAIVYDEFAGEGVPASLHVNARTCADYRRWAEFIGHRTDITDIAFEFTTGTRHSERRSQHVEWLMDLARSVERPLNLQLRGGVEAVPLLRGSFRRITCLLTTPFMKTAHRQRAERRSDGSLIWTSAKTDALAPLDDLLAHNIAVEVKAVSELVGAGPV